MQRTKQQNVESVVVNTKRGLTSCSKGVRETNSKNSGGSAM